MQDLAQKLEDNLYTDIESLKTLTAENLKDMEFPTHFINKMIWEERKTKTFKDFGEV